MDEPILIHPPNSHSPHIIQAVLDHDSLPNLSNIITRGSLPLRQFLPPMASYLMARTRMFQFGFGFAADINGKGAAGLEFAAGRRVGWGRDFTNQLLGVSAVVRIE